MRKHFKERYASEGFEMTLNPPLPQSFSIELNNTCNHRCVFCEAHSSHLKNPMKTFVMDKEFAKRLIDNASNLGIGKKELGLYMNGEPFLYPHLEEIVKYANEKGTFPYIYLTSNGTVKEFSKLQAVIDAGISSIRFSVNGTNKEDYKRIHGRDDFDTVVSNIKRLCEYRENKGLNFAISISSVVTPITQNNEESLTELFGDLVDDILFMKVFKTNRFDNDEEFFYSNSDMNTNDNYKCKSIFESMFIDAAGHVLLCCTSETYFNASTYVTQINPNGEIELDKVWNMPMYQKYRRLFIEGKDLNGTVCENCIIRKRSGQTFAD